MGEIVTIIVQTWNAHRFLLSHPIGWKERRRPHMGNLHPGLSEKLSKSQMHTSSTLVGCHGLKCVRLKFILWSPNLQYFWTWPYLEMRLLQMQLSWGHSGVGWILTRYDRCPYTMGHWETDSQAENSAWRLEWCCHKPRQHLKSGERPGNGSSSRVFRGSMALPTDLDLGL